MNGWANNFFFARIFCWAWKLQLSTVGYPTSAAALARLSSHTVKNQKSIEEEINSELSKNGVIPTQTVNELNDILRRLFKEKKVVGVSLKKISGREAKFEQVNIIIY